MCKGNDIMSVFQNNRNPEEYNCLQAFINGIRQSEITSNDIDNDLLCRRLEEIYLSI